MYKMTICIGSEKKEYYFAYENKLIAYLQCFEDDFGIEFFGKRIIDGEFVTNAHLTIKEAINKCDGDMVYFEADIFSGWIESLEEAKEYFQIQEDIYNIEDAEKMNREIAKAEYTG